MAKLYTLDHKLLTETPELRIGEKIFAVDNRQKTVKKIQAVKIDKDDPYTGMEEVMALALGQKAQQEIDEMNLPFPAYQELFALLMDAVLGSEPGTNASRFQAGEQT